MRAPTFSFLVLNFFSLICVTPALLPAPNLPRAEENNLTELAQSKPPTGSLAVSQNPKAKAAFAAPTACCRSSIAAEGGNDYDQHPPLQTNKEEKEEQKQEAERAAKKGKSK